LDQTGGPKAGLAGEGVSVRLSRQRERVNRMRDMASVSVSRDYEKVMAPAARAYEAILRKITEYVPTARSVIDLGTGPGFLLPRLARAYPSATVTGLDIGPEMLSLARGRVAEAGVADRVRLVEGSTYEIPLPDASFDLAVATSTIHMLDYLARFVRAARRVIGDAGSLVIVDQRRDVSLPVYAVAWGSTFTLRLLGRDIDGMGPVIDGCYTADELSQALADAGFSRRDVSTSLMTLEAWARA
jgi:ubiquinone/menaquinone biosynthesis C-methylase UbiE